MHSPQMLEMLETKLSRTLIEYVVDCVAETVDYAMGRPSTSARGRPLSRHTDHTNFLNFVTNVLHKAEVKVPVLLVTLVYIDRAKPHLQIALEQWACERVFLGALILANKYCNDSTLKNVHWALCTGVFGKRDVGRIEREFLDVLDYELGLTESDVLSHHDAIMSLSQPAHRVRVHQRSAVSAPTSPVSKQQHRRSHSSSQVKLTPPSRWSSSESSDSDEESASSTPLQTPDMDVDAPFVPVALAKHTPEEVHHPAAAPLVRTPAPSVHPVHAKPTAADLHVHAVSAHAPSSHPRLSSALQLLRSFPIPHFHSSSSSSSLSSSSPHSSSSSASSSSASSAVSIPPCKPVHLAAPRARPAQVC
ncbi:hypothetical protein EIP86_004412 [Pleurotus ostreatoroseus]|nr:hypothetical protein EIP86_004412 [Pleurotus ostreatoroseus]